MSLKDISVAVGSALSAAVSPAAETRPAFQSGDDREVLMPAHFGRMPDGQGSLDYLDVTTIAVSYLTDADRLRRYLPRPLEVGREPRITVFYAMNHEVEWLAGGCYNLLGVNAEVRFEGEVDQLDGSFCLALWENSAIPITFGRELYGIPKIFADIADPAVLRGVWRTGASLNGHRIVDMQVDSLQRLPDDRLAEAAQRSRDANWLGWKYIPNIGAPGAALSHATLLPTSAEPHEIWVGRGEVTWHELTWDQNPTQCHIAAALASLPILGYGAASVSKGATSLQSPGKAPRALR